MKEALETEILLTYESDSNFFGGMTYDQWKSLPPEEKSAIRPKIVCLYDMGWNQRTNGKYKSPSGHAYLIGARSKKIIGLITLRKICRICNRVENAFNKKNIKKTKILLTLTMIVPEIILGHQRR